MALAALTSSKLTKELKTAEQVHAALEFQNSERVLSLGISALDEVLPQQGLAYGSVIELQVGGASGAATSFALCACRAAQSAGELRNEHGAASDRQIDRQIDRHLDQKFVDRQIDRHLDRESAERRWCAFIDPSASLFAPGVAQLGVELDRLLVVRPDVEAVERVAVRIAEAKIISILVIDLRGALGDLAVDARRWQRTIRRLALAVKQLSTCVLVITPAEPRHALPLPVAMRLEFRRLSADSFELRVGKERTGRVSPPRTIAWSALEGAAS